ncbi:MULTISPECIES: YciI family protein [Streptomyces]|uniref:YciI family protein n=1 Tax=Streptomyces TaxID=1883 RepID=UPI0029B01D6F|nr:YciI family protein [Streptomyces scabiei]MDX3111987.1 YciI family protein [Streptomyces scabiei]
MTHYLLSVVQPVGAEPPAAEELAAVMRRVQAYNDELRAAGAWVFAGGLHGPETATVLRPKDGDVLVTDGPYAEGKEYLGGLCLIKAADLDEALEWGRKAALATTLPIEVRPFADAH